LTGFGIPVETEYKPIGAYGVIGNTRTVALVGYDGSIDWCCLPRFDSPSIFAAILDRRVGGNWSLTPAERGQASQRYVKNTNILVTEFNVRGSKTIITDFMPCSNSRDAWATPPEIHRILNCVEGKMRFRLSLNPRFDYGLVQPEVTAHGPNASFRGPRDEMVLASTLRLKSPTKGRLSEEFEMSRGDREVFVLSYGESQPRQVSEYKSAEQLRNTEMFWRTWVRKLQYRGRWRREVMRSILTLKLLVYSPTGAIVAAPTTSLPEAYGQDKNWDYRFSWIRDSAHSLWAFHLLGDTSEAERYLRFLIETDPALDLNLQLMYNIQGPPVVGERTLAHLEGYRGNKPVRVGNAAAQQFQMDTYGYMLDALHFSSRHGAAVTPGMYYRFVRPLASFIVDHWRLPGNGIWELRGRKQHYVETKAWCYAGLERAVEIAKASKHREDIPPWHEAMKSIKREILSKGWSKRKNAFRMHYGTDDLDSANLMLPLIGFLKPRDKRIVSTVNAITKELAQYSLLYRYRSNGGRRNNEGAFLVCSFWLVACLARMGQTEKALKVFKDLLGYSNHLGLYSEEINPKNLELMGNFPQAFSHMGLIMAAVELDQALDKS
jgi:GH15 family glucan-1,4-alpha-glucosidase